MTSLPLVSDIFYEQKWVPTGKNRWFGCYGIVFVHLNDFEMVDVFFLRLDICFSILARSTGESEGLKKRYIWPTQQHEEKWMWWQNMNWWKFSLQGVFFVGLLYRFGNSFPFYPKQLQVCYSMCLLRFCSLPTWCFFKTWHKHPGTFNNQYFNGKVRNCVFFLTVPQGGELDSRVRMCRKNWNCVDQPHSIHPWDWYIYLHLHPELPSFVGKYTMSHWASGNYFTLYFPPEIHRFQGTHQHSCIRDRHPHTIVQPLGHTCITWGVKNPLMVCCLTSPYVVDGSEIPRPTTVWMVLKPYIFTYMDGLDLW